MSDPNSRDASDSRPDPPLRRRIAPQRWLLLFFLGIFLASLVVVWLPYEITRWYVAAAEVAESVDNLAEAERLLTVAIQREPKNPMVYAKRAHLRAELGNQQGAYADCEEVIRLLPDDPQGYHLRGSVNFELGNHEKAVDDFKTVVRMLEEDPSRTDPATAYNSLAYAQAVGKIELDEAIGNADQAVKLTGDEQAFLDALVACVVHGYWDNSMARLNETVEFVERESERLAAPLKKKVDELMQTTVPPKPSRDIELRRLQRTLARIDRRLAVIRRFHVMVKDRQDGSQDGQPDPQEFETETAELPDSNKALSQLMSMSAVLDTRGFAYIQRQRPAELPQARRDMDAAAIAAEAVYHLQSSPRARHSAIDVHSFNQAVRNLQEQVAVIRYHRTLVLEAQAETTLAEKDRQRVRELNFEPGPDLF